jgi:hypothetical protein
MACRLVNLHTYPLRIDLRGGETLVLPPGQMSRVLREELLYDNCHLAGWEDSGWIGRVPARLAEAEGEGAAPKPKPAPETVPQAAPKGVSATPEAPPEKKAPRGPATKE